MRERVCVYIYKGTRLRRDFLALAFDARENEGKMYYGSAQAGYTVIEWRERKVANSF